MKNSISKNEEKMNVKQLKTFSDDQLGEIQTLICGVIQYHGEELEGSTLWEISCEMIESEFDIEIGYENQFIGKIFDDMLEGYEKEYK